MKQTPHRMPRVRQAAGGAAATWVLAIAMALVGCSARPRGAGDTTGFSNASEAEAAMSPTRLAIHPLTRMGVDSRGRPALLLHVELRDRFDQNTRALGMLRVQAQRPGVDAIVTAGSGEDSEGEAAWVVDLTDPERNALLFDDLVTRTYAITLTDLPEWLVAWSQKREGVALGLGSPTVTAAFTFADPRATGGVGRTVTDSARLGR